MTETDEFKDFRDLLEPGQTPISALRVVRYFDSEGSPMYRWHQHGDESNLALIGVLFALQQELAGEVNVDES